VRSLHITLIFQKCFKNSNIFGSHLSIIKITFSDFKISKKKHSENISEFWGKANPVSALSPSNSILS
jgi:hypothetical protein